MEGDISHCKMSQSCKKKKIKKKKKKKKSNGKKKSTFLKDLDGLKYRNLNKEFKSYKNK